MCQFQIISSVLKSYTQLTSFFCNNSHLVVNGGPSCYSHEIIPSVDGNNCFFCGACCYGAWVGCLHSTYTGCLMFRFNFANNSETNGYFHPYYEVTTIIKDSIIVLSAIHNTFKILHFPKSNAVLQIEDTVIITPMPIQVQSQVTTKSVVETDFAPTHTPFRFRPKHSQCNYASKDFSNALFFNQKLLIIFSVFVPIFIT